MAQLEPCPACERHVRVASANCPFCDASLSEAFRATPPRAAPGKRLARAAMFAVGTAIATTSSGCYMSHQLGGTAPATDAGVADAEVRRDLGRDGGIAALYGVPPDPITEEDAGVEEDLGGISADYGSPPGR